MIRRSLAFVLLAASLLFGAMGYQAYAVTPSSGSSEEEVVLPLLSPRRLPALAGDLTQEAMLRSSVAKSLEGIPDGTACVSIQREGRPVYNDDVNTAYIPASTVKLFTATAALETWDSDARFTTRVVAEKKAEDGVIEGSVFLVGGGDPLLMSDDYVAAMGGHRNVRTSLETLADLVVSSGVRSIRGGIVGDDNRFDKVRYLDSWDVGYRTGGQVGPITALSVNQGFVLNGSARSAAADPAAQAAGKFAELLRARGIDVIPNGQSGVVPDGTHVVAELDSLPVDELVAEMLTESDNTTAEILTKNLGVENAKRGTFSDGLVAMREALQGAGLPLGGVDLVDGSGLDRMNRVTCNAVVAALARDKSDGVIGRSMAKAGESGTLQTRLGGTLAVGRIQAKTGTLSGVSALAGWARPEGQQPFNFVIITNGVATQASRSLEDQLATLLASQPKTTPLAAVFAPGA